MWSASGTQTAQRWTTPSAVRKSQPISLTFPNTFVPTVHTVEIKYRPQSRNTRFFFSEIVVFITLCWPFHYFNVLGFEELLYPVCFYCICTQYLVGALFAWITASIRRGMEVISLRHCWGRMEAQVSLIVAFSSSACLVSCFSFSSWQYLIYSLRGSGLVSLLASQAHQHHGHLTNVWCFWQCGQVPNPAGKWNQHLLLVSRRKHVVLHNFLVNGCSDVGFQKTQWTNTSRWHCTPNHHRLWKLNTGLQATWAMSFSTLPPDSRTLVSKWNTKLALIWKEDFGPLCNSPVLLLLSPGKTPLTTTIAKFLDTSVCGGSWCLDPSLSSFLVKFTQILESILLDNPHKAAVLSVGCASFSFHSTFC